MKDEKRWGLALAGIAVLAYVISLTHRR